MRHRKHNHLLGVKTAHRTSLLANLSCSLIENGRIKTTLAKARALRPSIEKVITLAKKANATTDAAQKVHFRRLAISRLRNKQAVKKLFDELVEQFVNRNGGYTRIYKLAMPRLGDAADMAIIEFVEDTPKKKGKKKKASSKKPAKETKKSADSSAEDDSDSNNPAEDESQSKKDSKPEDSKDSATEPPNEESNAVDEETDAEATEASADAESSPESESEEDSNPNDGKDESKDESTEGEPEASVEAESAPEAESEEDSESKDDEKKSKD